MINLVKVILLKDPQPYYNHVTLNDFQGPSPYNG